MNATVPLIDTIDVEIFDPPMCCPSGLCGPTVDPALLQISEALLRITAEFGEGVRVQRYLLAQQGQKFLENPDVMALLRREGVSALPITLVNGSVIAKSSYPSFDQLKEAVSGGKNQ